jgi:hypothetical protein
MGWGLKSKVKKKVRDEGKKLEGRLERENEDLKRMGSKWMGMVKEMGFEM